MARLSRGNGMSYASIAKLVGRYNGMSDAQVDALHRDLITPVAHLDVWQMSMAEATDYVTRRLRYRPNGGRDGAFKNAIVRDAARLCMGDEQRSAATIADAELLVDAVLQRDPRLARRARWHRGDEGELACPALIAAGDDAPFFFRRRGDLSEANGGEPIRLVISTDSNEIKPGTAAAFIAAVKILQQWRSVEVWWQGSWLGSGRTNGWVFLVPLVQGDMDFTRLDFCLSNSMRDTVSYAVMVTRTCEVTRRMWNGCNHTADRSFLTGAPSHLISHNGLSPDARTIAHWCAWWLGFEHITPDAGDNLLIEPALQALPRESTPPPQETEAQREKRQREYEQAERARRESDEEAARRRAMSVED